MKYLEYDIRLANPEEISSAMYYLMQGYMQGHSKEELDDFLKNYYLNDDYLNKCRLGLIPLYVCYNNDLLIGALCLKDNVEEILMFNFEIADKNLWKELFIFALKDYLVRYINSETLSISKDTPYKDFLLSFGFCLEEDKLVLRLKHPLQIQLDKCNNSWKFSVIKLLKEATVDLENANELTDDYLNSYVSNWLDNIIVAIYENKVVGFSFYENSSVLSEERIARILFLYVIKQYRGYGIGKALLQKTLEVISYKKVVVNIESDNLDAIDFITRHNFNCTGEKKDIDALGKVVLKGNEYAYSKLTCKLTKLEAIKERRSVRNFTSNPVDSETIKELNNFIEILNRESGLSFRIVQNNPEPFKRGLDQYGQFTNVNQYFALIGPKSFALEEKCGYYGERLVIHATEMGLGTCWVTLTYDKKLCNVDLKNEEKLVAVIPFGYFSGSITPHKSKPIEQLYAIRGAEKQGWFFDGVEAAALAPTAFNQQKFLFTLTETGKVKLESKPGIFTSIDLGIAKYHFEVGTNGARFSFKK